MKLRDIYSQNNDKSHSFYQSKAPIISFEIFPPKNDIDGMKLEKLFNHLKILKDYKPAFISLTYGAGGTNQNSSLDIITRLQKNLNLSVMPHFTCVNNSKSNVESYLEQIAKLEIKNILALRGDIPEGIEQKNFDFHYANELVEFIKTKTNLSIAVAGYPEGHMECENIEIDLKNLKRKVDTGADVIYTQMFFDNKKFFSFIESARKIGINIPIIPGILPIRSYSQLERMLTMAKVSVPKILRDKLYKYKDNDDDIKKIGIEFSIQQCQELISSGVAGLHFYTLNTSSSVAPILDNLKICV